MQRIFLIGYMGAGKTTLGKALAQTMNLTFIDLDNFIEARHCKTIRDIFGEVGESGFRDIERRALIEVASFEDVIISLGGGTPCFFDNMDIVNKAGVSVYLKPSEAVLLKRLIKGKHKRPVIAEKSDDELLAFIRQQLDRRESYYLRASFVYPSDNLENKADIIGRADDLAQKLRTINKSMY